MNKEISKSNSVSYVPTRTEIQETREDLKEVLDNYATVLLAVARNFGENSEEYTIAERYIELAATAYNYINSLEDFVELCQQHRKIFGAAAAREIIAMERIRKNIQEMASAQGVN